MLRVAVGARRGLAGSAAGLRRGGARIAAIAPRLPMLALIACGSAEGAAFDGLGVRGLAQLDLDIARR